MSKAKDGVFQMQRSLRATLSNLISSPRDTQDLEKAVQSCTEAKESWRSVTWTSDSAQIETPFTQRGLKESTLLNQSSRFTNASPALPNECEKCALCSYMTTGQ
jgi:hypothetical protein